MKLLESPIVASEPRPVTVPRAVVTSSTLPPEPSAANKRASLALFGTIWSLQALLPQLPLRFPIALDSELDLPPSPKLRYRSKYRYLGPEPLRDPAQLANLSDFQIALHLIDFSPLERPLAQIYVPSLKGQVPFHPVSMFLCICLRREQNLPWAVLARLIAGEDGSHWRRLFGFDQATPSASGLRYFFQTVGPDIFDALCPRFVTLLRQHRLFPETSTYPGDPPDRGITVSQDGMLHQARSRPSCELAEDSCYQPLPEPQESPPSAEPKPGPEESAAALSLPSPETASPETASPETVSPETVLPGSAPLRPCRASRHGGEGCACESAACQQQCRRASRQDPEARLIHYAGHNHKHGERSQAKPTGEAPRPPDDKRPSRGINLFGYRSVVDRALDDRFAIAWNLQTGLYSANTDERTIFSQRLAELKVKLPDLRIGEWLDDAGVGYGPCLAAIYELGALRMVEIRADPSDSDREACLRRGYDGQGYPLCPHGYRLRSNGYDYERRRSKWVCAQVCRREAVRKGAAIQPVEGCPYLDEVKPLGYVVNVAKTLPDGSIRLAREIPYGSEPWKARYARRNSSESRNGQIEGMGLKRMQSYGLARNIKEVQLADFLMNLHTLGRLVREATSQAIA